MLGIKSAEFVDRINHVVVLACSEVEFDRVKADDYETGVALFTSDDVALFAFGVNVNVFAAFGADRCGHGAFLLYSNKMWHQLRDYHDQNRYPYQSNLFGDVLARQ